MNLLTEDLETVLYFHSVQVMVRVWSSASWGRCLFFERKFRVTAKKARDKRKCSILKSDSKSFVKMQLLYFKIKGGKLQGVSIMMISTSQVIMSCEFLKNSFIEL